MSRLKNAVGEPFAAAVLAVVSIAIAAAIVMLAYPMLSSGVEGVSERAAVAERQMAERLTLVYWEPGGAAWISNDGDVPVTIVAAYIDGSRVDVEATLQPGEMARLELIPGSELAVITDTGQVHILAEGWLPPAGGVEGGGVEGGGVLSVDIIPRVLTLGVGRGEAEAVVKVYGEQEGRRVVYLSCSARPAEYITCSLDEDRVTLDPPSGSATTELKVEVLQRPPGGVDGVVEVRATDGSVTTASYAQVTIRG